MLITIRQSRRLKGAPPMRCWEIGRYKRELFAGFESLLGTFERRASSGERLTAAEQSAFQTIKALFDDPAVNPYSLEERSTDLARSKENIELAHHFDEGRFILDDPQSARETVQAHFHAIDWPELSRKSWWDLIIQVVPPLLVTRPTLEIYEQDRWLYDECAQRAAEALSFRLNQDWPSTIEVNPTQQAIFERYLKKLQHGEDVNPRRWIKTTLAQYGKKPTT